MHAWLCDGPEREREREREKEKERYYNFQPHRADVGVARFHCMGTLTTGSGLGRASLAQSILLTPGPCARAPWPPRPACGGRPRPPPPRRGCARRPLVIRGPALQRTEHHARLRAPGKRGAAELAPRWRRGAVAAYKLRAARTCRGGGHERPGHTGYGVNTPACHEACLSNAAQLVMVCYTRACLRDTIP